MDKKIAIMQPYLFPYIGYWQLLNFVDKFIIYDDVNYIKQGWINRNNILVQSKAKTFTIPLNNASSNKNINETYVNNILYARWEKKFIKTIEQSYHKAPYFQKIYDLIIKVLMYNENSTISELAYISIVEIKRYLNLKTKIIKSSSIYNNSNLYGKDRVIDICKIEKATDYINPIGGEKLYNKKEFKIENINLFFIESDSIIYKQFNHSFTPNLSIIDILMFNSIEETKEFLNKYSVL